MSDRRTGLSCVLAAAPDKPISALDPDTASDVPTAIHNLAAEGRTMLVLAHGIRFDADVGTRRAFMDQGKIMDEGNPRAMVADPQTERARKILRSIHD